MTRSGPLKHLTDEAAALRPARGTLIDLKEKDMNCPECNGPFLYNWVAKHSNTCTIRNADDATQNADHERLEDHRPWALTRPTTAAERTLLVAAGYTPSLHPETTITWQGYRHRVIDGHSAP